MKHTISIILIIIFSPIFGLSQNFGCYDLNYIDNNNNALDGAFARGDTFKGFFYKGDWKEFALDSNITDSYYRKYCYFETSCTQKVRMEGIVKNELQEGFWKLFLSEEYFFIGNFINGKKEGLWKGMYITEQYDTTCFSEIEFENNLYNGLTKHYTFDGKLYKIINYKNGLKTGQEIEYFRTDTSDVNYIEELKEYLDDKLNGKYLIYSYMNPFDTLTYGEYSFGKKNGRFIYNHYNGEKTIIDFVDDKVEGKFIKYYRNGTLAYELDYKNNLPYNLIQSQDSSGNIIESNTLTSGTGKLNCYYDNGSLFSSVNYNNQLISGKFCRYFKSGDIMEEGFLHTNNLKSYKRTRPIEECEDLNLFSAWQLNISDGTNYTNYNEDGSISAKLQSSFNDSIGEDIIICENYKNDKLLSKENLWRGLEFGQLIKYYEDGTLDMTGTYIILNNDSIQISVKDGVFKYYYPNGILKAEINYSSGKEIGSSYFYDDLGSIKRIKVIESNGESYNIYDNDTVNRIDKKGRKQGKWISILYPFLDNNCHNNPNYIDYYKDDNPIGTSEYYGFTGEQLSERIVWQDSLNAYYQRYNNGKLMEEGYMINEMKNSEWKEYDQKKGYLKFKGHYNCGKKEGLWQEFKRNGKMIKEIEYIEGQIKNAYNK